MENKHYITAKEVAEYIGVSVPCAYKICQKLNKELHSKGFITVAGRVPIELFLERTYAKGGYANGSER